MQSRFRWVAAAPPPRDPLRCSHPQNFPLLVVFSPGGIPVGGCRPSPLRTPEPSAALHSHAQNSDPACAWGGGGGSAGASSTSLVMGATNASGNAGNVTITNTGRIQTESDYSIGVVAQSVGGGGGRIASASGSLTLGADGGGGDAGNVTLDNTGGEISTSGDYAPSYLMQSVGGGGGQVCMWRR